jgi:hypothetical protein
MSGILAKYKDLRVHYDRDRTLDLQERIGRMSAQELDAIHVGKHAAGHVFLLESDGDPKVICEMAVSPSNGDSIGTLYLPHPIFNNRGAYLEAREEMVQLLLDMGNAGTLGLLVWCPARGRHCHVRDLPFAQMVDIATKRVQAALKTA